jgi:hypothetical protein
MMTEIVQNISRMWAGWHPAADWQSAGVGNSIIRQSAVVPLLRVSPGIRITETILECFARHLTTLGNGFQTAPPDRGYGSGDAWYERDGGARTRG